MYGGFWPKKTAQLDKTEKCLFFFFLPFWIKNYYSENDESGHYDGDEKLTSKKQAPFEDPNKMMHVFTLKEADPLQFIKVSGYVLLMG